MSQPKKSAEQIQAMREAGKILASILHDVREQAKPGVTGRQIDAWAAKEIVARGASATYREPVPNFPGVICISVNDAIVHGVPTDEPFKNGDVVGFDLVITYKNMKVDSAVTVVIGEEPKGAVKHLIQTTERSLYAGIDAINGAGTMTGDIGAAVEAVLKKGKLGVIRDMVGHGVGNEMHMPPDVPNYGRKGSGTRLNVGDTIAIEPMATLGGERVNSHHEDDWTISTRDGSLSAHFEHTVLITETGVEILTKL